MDRFERQRQLFGDRGQERLRGTTVAVVGGGGLGSFVVVELAYLGVLKIVVIDDDRLDITNRNRLIGAWESHVEGELKVEILRALVTLIDSSVRVEVVPMKFQSPEGRRALEQADVVMGCVDRDAARLQLNEFCCERGIPLIDAASDTVSTDNEIYYGGRVCVASDATGCLSCFGVLDQDEMRIDLESPEQRVDRDAIYGMAPKAVGSGGPAVVSINGVVASLAVTELMVLVTGMRKSFAYLDYWGHDGVVRKVVDRHSDCYFCSLRPRGLVLPLR